MTAFVSGIGTISLRELLEERLAGNGASFLAASGRLQTTVAGDQRHSGRSRMRGQHPFDQLVGVSTRIRKLHAHPGNPKLAGPVGRGNSSVEHQRRPIQLGWRQLRQQKPDQPRAAALEITVGIIPLRHPRCVQQVVAVDNQEAGGHVSCGVEIVILRTVLP